MTRGSTIAVSVAPMLDVTDRHTRWLYRRISPRVLLYSEMVTTHALDHGDAAYLLGFDACEHPVALQLGGDDPVALARAARRGVDAGYDEINLNVGCPSSRVQRGSFGACLMRTPQVVADGVAAMRAAVDVPVTVKCRIGVDDMDAYEDLYRFTETVVAAGVDRLTVHARKAWLQGLSPKENRNVPPLRYAEVHRLKQAFPDLPLEINGGITTVDQVAHHLDHVDAVMIGRGVWHDPWMLAEVEARVLGGTPAPSREAVAEDFIAYAEARIAEGARAQHVLRHAGTLFAGVPGVRRWKQGIAAVHKGGIPAVREGLAAVVEAQARQAQWEAERAQAG